MRDRVKWAMLGGRCWAQRSWLCRSQIIGPALQQVFHPVSPGPLIDWSHLKLMANRYALDVSVDDINTGF